MNVFKKSNDSSGTPSDERRSKVPPPKAFLGDYRAMLLKSTSGSFNDKEDDGEELSIGNGDDIIKTPRNASRRLIFNVTTPLVSKDTRSLRAMHRNVRPRTPSLTIDIPVDDFPIEGMVGRYVSTWAPPKSPLANPAPVNLHPKLKLVSCVVRRHLNTFHFYYQHPFNNDLLLIMTAEREVTGDKSQTRIYDMTKCETTMTMTYIEDFPLSQDISVPSSSGRCMGKLVHEQANTFHLHHDGRHSGGWNGSQVASIVYKGVPVDSGTNNNNGRGGLRFKLKKSLSRLNALPRSCEVAICGGTRCGVRLAHATAIAMEKTSDLSTILNDKRQQYAGLFVFPNKLPYYHGKGKFGLNFKGRGKYSSSKNMQLVDPADDEKVILQFVKDDFRTFHLDFAAPFNAFQAFGFAIAQLTI